MKTDEISRLSRDYQRIMQHRIQYWQNKYESKIENSVDYQVNAFPSIQTTHQGKSKERGNWLRLKAFISAFL